MPNSWQTRPLWLLCTFAVLTPALPLVGQTPAPSPYIASTRAQALQMAGVQISGDVHVANGDLQLGNGSTITAGSDTVPITLNRGGELKLCATTSVHLARDGSIQAADDTGLMLGLDRGAIEAHYEIGKYSDVLLTPDLRILISGPGEADLAIRVSRQGDTCIDNRGPNAPYITVTSQLEGGLYRVQPGQHVSFLHGSLREVVDTEHEPCGCPAPVSVPVSVADAGTSAPVGAAPGHPVGGPTSTPADTAFPLAVSEGLTKAPMPPTTPVAGPGEVHAQVAVPFRYDGTLPTVSDTAGTGGAGGTDLGAIPPPSSSAPAPSPSEMPAPRPSAPPPGSAPVSTVIAAQPAIARAPEPAPAQKPPSRNIFRRVGRFFSRLFGAEQ
jgi:hypothetical protein